MARVSKSFVVEPWWVVLALMLGFGMGGSAQAAIRHDKSAVSPATKLTPSAKAAPHGRDLVKRAVPKRGVRSGRVTAKSAARAVRVVKPRPMPVAAKVAELNRRPSFGQMSGLHATPDPLDLKSSVALVLDQDSQEVLFSKNQNAVLPIASLTKLMTAVVVVEAGQSLEDLLTVSEADIDLEKGSHSRLTVGTTLTRGMMLHLALMSSENRAAHALGRHYPGGLAAFVAAMNAKAADLGMVHTRYVEPTGLSSQNQSSAADLAVLVRHAHQFPMIRALSTTPESAVQVGAHSLQFRNTNGLVRNPSWEIGLQKTGYIVEAGRCLVMQAEVAGRRLIMVFLDSAGKYSRIADAERIRRWVSNSVQQAGAVPTRASAVLSGLGS